MLGIKAIMAPTSTYSPDALSYGDRFPEEYKAFVASSISVDVMQAGLMNVTAKDGRLKMGDTLTDFLACFECWLAKREKQTREDLESLRIDPNVPKHYAHARHIRMLDLSNNGMGDDALNVITDFMSQHDVQCDWINLSKNKLRKKGAVKVTDYMWRSTKVILQLNLSDNLFTAVHSSCIDLSWHHSVIAGVGKSLIWI